MKEVCWNLPAVLYLPDITSWWDMMNEALFLSHVDKMKNSVFLLATAHEPYSSLSQSVSIIVYHLSVKTLLVDCTG